MPEVSSNEAETSAAVPAEAAEQTAEEAEEGQPPVDAETPSSPAVVLEGAVSSPPSANPSVSSAQKHPYHRIQWFLGSLGADLLVTLLFLTPFIPWIWKIEGAQTDGFAGRLVDLAAFCVMRVLASLLALLVSYCRAKVRPEYPFPLEHDITGKPKTREELEQEALEEGFMPWLIRFITRPAFSLEVLAVATQVLAITKCLWRMNVEIGTLHNAEHYHPVFWLAILWTSATSLFQASVLDSICQLAAQYGDENTEGRQQSRTFLRTISSHLSIPLLAGQDNEGEEGQGDADADEARNDEANGQDEPANDVVGSSDITSDTDYKASWTDLLKICAPDVGLLAFAFVFLILAAISQTLIPLYLGHILDALSKTFNEGFNEGNDSTDDDNSNESMFDVPGFISNMKLLVLVSITAGVFSGLRGSIFTVVGGRVNVRLRVQLMDALLAQDIGFFDVTKTGDITSRLSSDTTLVGDQVTLNVNVFLRSLVQALGVLGFMFVVSWQLTILAFISIPVITILSRWYGNYVRSLTKLMQKKLADGNSVSESVFSAMTTVNAFDAAQQELEEFEKCMSNYLSLNVKSSVAYCGYACFTTALPELVFAVVVFYGGLLVRNESISSGQLVSFLLYLQSLSDAIASMGWVFGSLTQAVGAADKVFELLHRKPRRTQPAVTDTAANGEVSFVAKHYGASKTNDRRLQGLVPESVKGDIELRNVTLYYPARPQRRILDNLSLKIEAGSIVALVGQSGGGKSSVMSLILHQYEQQSGDVLLDSHPVHDLCPSWLSRHVSIVSQEPTLFARSISKNIMYGLEGTDMEPTQEDVEAAAKLANAHDFIVNMPHGYDTEVGERGVQLSGGQKQRIAIARALIRRPRVLLLDEATSALDAESEHAVQQAIDDMLARGKQEEGAMTVVIVAHRLSTVRSADKIFVIKDGKVVEEGNHDKLTQNPSGAYSALIRRQMDAQSKLEAVDK